MPLPGAAAAAGCGGLGRSSFSVRGPAAALGRPAITGAGWDSSLARCTATCWIWRAPWAACCCWAGVIFVRLTTLLSTLVIGATTLTFLTLLTTVVLLLMTVVFLVMLLTMTFCC